MAKLRDGQFILESGFSKASGLSSPLASSKGGQECPPSFQSGLENPFPVDVPGRLEDKVKSFCAIPQVLAFLKDYIVFAEKDKEMNKYILRQHQTGTVDAIVAPSIPGAFAASSGYVSGQPYRVKS